jgi:hypothetical protein
MTNYINVRAVPALSPRLSAAASSFSLLGEAVDMRKFGSEMQLFVQFGAIAGGGTATVQAKMQTAPDSNGSPGAFVDAVADLGRSVLASHAVTANTVVASLYSRKAGLNTWVRWVFDVALAGGATGVNLSAVVAAEPSQGVFNG